MNLSFTELLPSDFHPKSRVWIYQSSRVFSLAETEEIQKLLEDFIKTWTSHGAEVKGFARLIFGQFILLMADETQATIGGCSTDHSVRFIKEIERMYGVNLFDRQALAFVVNDQIQVIPLQQIGYALKNGYLKPDTLYVNNLVQTKEELEVKWFQPIQESWMGNKFLVRE